MLVSEVITGFEQYVDDATELSSVQELALAQKIFNKLWSDRAWEFTKASASGVIAVTTPHITKPSDFAAFLENAAFTDNSLSVDTNAAPKAIYVGASFTPYQIINWSDRRSYRSRSGYAYLDLTNSGITFTATPTAGDIYEFDYKKTAPTLTLNTDLSLYFLAEYHPMLYHRMAVDDDMIQRFPKAASYAAENEAAYQDYLGDMAIWNASLSND